MRSQQPPPERKAAIATTGEGLDPTATVQSPALDSTGSETASTAPPESDRDGKPRLHSPDRQQLLSSMIIDELLEPDHPARAVWSYVEALDLTPLYDRIRARGCVAGRPA